MKVMPNRRERESERERVIEERNFCKRRRSRCGALQYRLNRQNMQFLRKYLTYKMSIARKELNKCTQEVSIAAVGDNLAL